MAWNTHPSVITGQTWSASDQNTYVKGNLDTLFPYTASKQIAVSTSSTTLTSISPSAAYDIVRANSGNTALEFGSIATTVGYGSSSAAALLILRSNSANTALEFGTTPIVYGRQGGSTTRWDSTGTTNYTGLADNILQCGYASVTPSSSNPVTMDWGSTYYSTFSSVTYPVAFSKPPLVFIHNNFASTSPTFLGAQTNNSASSFIINIRAPVSATNYAFFWMAIGEK